MKIVQTSSQEIFFFEEKEKLVEEIPGKPAIEQSCWKQILSEIDGLKRGRKEEERRTKLLHSFLHSLRVKKDHVCPLISAFFPQEFFFQIFPNFTQGWSSGAAEKRDQNTKNQSFFKTLDPSCFLLPYTWKLIHSLWFYLLFN